MVKEILEDFHRLVPVYFNFLVEEHDCNLTIQHSQFGGECYLAKNKTTKVGIWLDRYHVDVSLGPTENIIVPNEIGKHSSLSLYRIAKCLDPSYEMEIIDWGLENYVELSFEENVKVQKKILQKDVVWRFFRMASAS